MLVSPSGLVNLVLIYLNYAGMMSAVLVFLQKLKKIVCGCVFVVSRVFFCNFVLFDCTLISAVIGILVAIEKSVFSDKKKRKF